MTRPVRARSYWGGVDQDDKEALEQRIGTELRSKWTLERLLGSGGMAAVYVGLHRIGRRDAIKILHPHVASEPELRARFEQEARAVNRFHHRGAVEIRDIDVTDDGAPFLVMELLAGESLSERAKRGLLPLEEVLGYVEQLLDVLSAAHAEGIVHRDVKPDNLFILPDGRIKVLDFGIARVRDGTLGRPTTRAGLALGTVSYMPPEQLRGIDVDHRADLFAVGATMLRLLTGRRVHDAKKPGDLLVLMATTPAPPVLSVAPEVPVDVAAVLDRALAFAKEQRYADAATMQADVRSLLRGEKPLHTDPPRRPTPPPGELATSVALSPVSAPTGRPTSTGAVAGVEGAHLVGTPPKAPFRAEEPTSVERSMASVSRDPVLILDPSAPPDDTPREGGPAIARSRAATVVGPEAAMAAVVPSAAMTAIAPSASALATLPLPAPEGRATVPDGVAVLAAQRSLALLPTVASASPVLPAPAVSGPPSLSPSLSARGSSAAPRPSDAAFPPPTFPPALDGDAPRREGLVVALIVMAVAAVLLVVVLLVGGLFLFISPSSSTPPVPSVRSTDTDVPGGTDPSGPPDGPPGREKDKKKKKDR